MPVPRETMTAETVPVLDPAWRLITESQAKIMLEAIGQAGKAKAWETIVPLPGKQFFPCTCPALDSTDITTGMGWATDEYIVRAYAPYLMEAPEYRPPTSDLSENYGFPAASKKEVRFCRVCGSWMIEGRKSDHVKSVQHKAKMRQAADVEKDTAVARVYKKLRPLIDLSESVRGKLEQKKVRPLIDLSESVRGKLEQIKVRSLVEIPAGVRAKFEKEKAVKKKPIAKKRETASRPKNMGGTRKIIGKKKRYVSAPKRLTATNR